TSTSNSFRFSDSTLDLQHVSLTPRFFSSLKVAVRRVLLFYFHIVTVNVFLSDSSSTYPHPLPVVVFQRADRLFSRSSTALRPRSREIKTGEELTAKLLRLDDLVRMENDVMEPKRKRSFPGNNAPLDRLSISSMETKQTTNKQSKVVELPRRRANPPPIDRIGMSRLPNSRG
ncbi:osteocrin, partial [Labrus mixtus]|uniref:osteocrin n=1 Tax=Labrus mixtus TaxID=508554 RepID=UPI0029C02346